MRPFMLLVAVWAQHRQGRYPEMASRRLPLPRETEHGGVSMSDEVEQAADRLDAALDPEKRGGWSRLIGDEVDDLRTVLRAARRSEPVTPEAGTECWCSHCRPGAWWMILCPDCRNKRCPRATWHGYQCGKSNEPGQLPVPVVREEGNSNE